MKIKECFEYIHKLILDNSDINNDEEIIENHCKRFYWQRLLQKMLNKIKVIFNSLLSKKDELLEFSKKYYDACHELNNRSMSMFPNFCSKFIIYDNISKKVLDGFLERMFHYSNKMINYIENFYCQLS